MAERLVEALFTALDEQTVVVPCTDAAALIVPKLAKNLAALLDQCAELSSSIEELSEVHPLSEPLTSIPGTGVRTGARILIYVGDGSAVPTAGHLAPYSGLAPATRRSGSSNLGESPSGRGSKHLKRAFPLAAFASLSDPASRACYERKKAEGRRHEPALMCLTPRRAHVLFATLRKGTFFQPHAIHQTARIVTEQLSHSLTKRLGAPCIGQTGTATPAAVETS